MRRAMVPEDVAELLDVGDPRVSPDGRTVAFVVTTVNMKDNEYRSRVWLAAVDGSERPRPYTNGEAQDCRPRWSPDGASLAFVSHREEQGSQLFVIPFGLGGEVRRIASSNEEIEDLAWSPDGRTLAFTSRDRDEDRYGIERAKDQPARRVERFFSRLDHVGWTMDRPMRVFTVSADRWGERRAITAGPFQDSGLAWSPDGGRIAFASGRHDTWDLDRCVDLFVVPSVVGDSADGVELQRVTATGYAYGRPSWSPDGSRLAFTRGGDPADGPHHGQIGVLDLTSGAERLVSETLDRQCAPFLPGAREPIWDGDDLVFAAEDSGNVHIYRTGASGSGKPELVVGGDRQVTGWDAAAGTLAFTAGTATELTDLFVIGADGAERRLTSLGRDFATRVEAVAPERFMATSADGSEVEAWVIRPAGFVEGEQYPALLNIHGGPFTQYGNKLFDEFQVQAGAGYVVVYCNPRGSSGYSESWGRAIRGCIADVAPGSGWGGVDYEDVMAVVDSAVERFAFIDDGRIGVLGGSYGGYMTSWIVGHTERFAAACSERAVNDMSSLEYQSDIATAFRAYMGASHLDAPDEYRRVSPISYVRSVETPVLILHSEDDLRCPISQAEALFVALRMLGKEVEFVRFPGESHELSRSGAPRHRVERLEIILDFFARRMPPGS